MVDNITRFGSVQGGKTEEKKLPIRNYVLVDIDDNDYDATGFLIFSTHHVAVMEDTSDGAVPVLVVPMERFKVAFIDDEVTDEPLPF